MKKATILLLLAMIGFGCQTQNQESEELKALKEQNDLLKSQLEEKKEKAAIPKREKKKSVCPNIERIKNDLLGRKVSYKKPGKLLKGNWEFAALSEFIGVNILEESSNSQVCEKTLYLQLQDMDTKRPYEMKIYVRYRKDNNDWYFDDLQCQYYDY